MFVLRVTSEHSFTDLGRMDSRVDCWLFGKMVPTMGLEPRTEDVTRFATLRLNHSATPPIFLGLFPWLDATFNQQLLSNFLVASIAECP